VFNALDGIGHDRLQMHPLGNRIGRRFMGFFRYSL
jgi:iron complex outermembrane receptor protein